MTLTKKTSTKKPLKKKPSTKSSTKAPTIEAVIPAGFTATLEMKHPIDNLYWVRPELLRANDYNPNHVFTREMQLLETSIIEDGFTQPVVVYLDPGQETPPTWQQALLRVMVGSSHDGYDSAFTADEVDTLISEVERVMREAAENLTGTVVDGYHRTTIAAKSEPVRARTGERVPVVFLDTAKSLVDRKYSTVRHNRARGQHGILKMSDIIRDVAAATRDVYGEALPDEVVKKEVVRRMGLEREEYDRLTDFRSSPELRGKESFGKGWVPIAAPPGGAYQDTAPVTPAPSATSTEDEVSHDG